MSQTTFTPDDWAGIRRDYTAWWEGRLDRPLLYLADVTPDGRPRDGDDFHGFLSNYPPDVTPAQIVEKYLAYESRRVYLGDTFPFWFINFGAGILAAPLGARVNSTIETVWFAPPADAEVDRLRIRFDPNNFWWRRLVDVTRTAVDMIGDRVQISYTDLGGNLDILASLLGSEALLFALVDCPEKVDALAREVTRVWLSAYDELDRVIRRKCPGTHSWAPLWAPGTTYILQSDFSYMISPGMFKRFVMPDLVACCHHIEYPFYHLDGIGELPHLDHLLSIEKLRGIQWIYGDGKPPAEEWPDLYRAIRSAGKLVQVFVTREGAKKICREVGGKGFIMRVGDTMSVDEAHAFLDEMRAITG